jgi:methyl-accepting chemotaxis protein
VGTGRRGADLCTGGVARPATQQEQTMSHNIPEWVYILFTAVTAFGVVMQAAVLLGMLVALRGALKRVNEISVRAEEIAVPAFESTRDLLKDISPKIKVAAQNLLEVSQTAKEVSQNAKEVSGTVKAESAQIAVALNDVLRRGAVQVDRIDEMVTGTLSSVAHATGMLQKAVSGPARQVGALLSGLRAGLDVLRKREHEVQAASDGDHFV